MRFSISALLALSGLCAGCMPVGSIVDLRRPEVVAWLRVRGPVNHKMGTSEYEAYRMAQAQRITSPPVLRAALRRPRIATLATLANERDPIKWLGDHVQVRTPAESEAIAVALRTKNAGEGAEIVNAIVDAFFSEYVRTERDARLSAYSELQGRYKEVVSLKREVHDEYLRLKRTSSANALHDEPVIQATRQHLEDLQKIADDISGQLESMAIELAMPDPVTLLEQARADAM